MKTLAEKIAVMQAAERGERIQFHTHAVGWRDFSATPPSTDWNWSDVDYRVKPTPRRVPLGPEDVKAGDMVRDAGATHGWGAICGARKGCALPEHDGIWLLGRKGLCVKSWDTARDHLEISRDGGKTWGPCWKEVE